MLITLRISVKSSNDVTFKYLVVKEHLHWIYVTHNNPSVYMFLRIRYRLLQFTLCLILHAIFTHVTIIQFSEDSIHFYKVTWNADLTNCSNCSMIALV